jgi:hypothetical protein
VGNIIFDKFVEQEIKELDFFKEYFISR